ncbi:MAG TPA: SPOR domain-containing protein [Candidatus Krumholzibacteria bacterium]|nr:SPOR domain-containing protein [Candidatus Krumholzibacteria bacterium]HPD72753.1 SPOR domain-containing protein [Candidatus Krumholzibacteria bacterium]HRY40315.1 SPOR domain-containing protein [Candidatus Krumholzibacteria bacterium]
MSDGHQLAIRPGGLETLSTGLNLAELDLHGGEGLWEEVRRFARESLLERQIDAAMGGRPAPRVWAFLESPGAGPAAAAAGLGAAVLLADRGQSVVLVDADEQEPRITRWAGRTDREGWIDMVRFGASLHTASDALPSQARRGSVVGVGSFAPTGVTPDEVAELLGRLRRQADDLVLVLPAKLRSLPWLEVAHIRLLCWDLLSRSAGETEKILSELERMGARPDALLGFGVEEYVAIQERLREDVAASAAPSPEPGPVTPALVPAAEPGPDAAPASGRSAESATGSGPTLASGPTYRAAGAARERSLPAPRRRRTSGIFVFVGVALIAALALLGLRFSGQLRGERTADLASSPAPVDLPAGERTPPVDRDQPPAAAALGATGAEVAADSAGSANAVADEDSVGVDEAASATGATAAPAARADSPAVDSGGDGGPWTPFRRPAGQEGWALWLYSFPDEATAEVEIRALERRGIQATARAVEIKDRGRWYRVYAGSFPDRAAAAAAVPWLKSELRHDWVVPAAI